MVRMMSSLETVDLSAIARDDAEEHLILRSAARDVGAFLVTGHGIDAARVTGLFAQTRALFALSAPERAAIEMIHSPFFRGYSPPGSERTAGRPDLREQFDVGPEEMPRNVAAGDPAYLRLHGPNAWPQTLPALRPAVLAWMRDLRSVAIGLLAGIAQSAGLPRDVFADAFSGLPHEQLKLIHYPAAAAADEQQGVGEHSDSGFLALIVQDGARGLQAYDGRRFVDVDARPGSIIAIAGRALEAATNGSVTACRHRVASSLDGRPRYSVSYFLNPRLDYAGYGDDALAVVLRSHPRTAQRFFPDLLPIT
jgi:isopenicillin N synthase-like dioxygenase